MPSLSALTNEIQAEKSAKASRGRSISALADRRPVPKEPEPFDFSVVEMIKNVPESGLQVAKDTLAPLLPWNWGETAKSFRDLAVGTASVALGADDPAEKTVKALADFYKKRYGTWENAQKTIQNDPMGFVSDAAAIFTAGGGAAAKAPGVVGKAGRKVARAGQALDVPGQMVAQGVGATANALSNKAAPRVMHSAAKLPPSLRKARDKIVRALLDEGISPTPRGLVKMERIIEGINGQIDEFISLADDRLGMVPTKNMFDAVDELIANAEEIFGGEAISDVKKLKKFRKNLEKSLTDSNGEVQSFTSVAKAQKSKKAAWEKSKFAGRAGKDVKNKFNKAVGRGTREAIEQTVTEGPIADLNARQAPLLGARDALEMSIGRQENTNILGGMSGLGAGAGVGVATGDPGSAFAAAMAAQTLGRGDVKGAIARGINQTGNAFSNAAAALYTPAGLAALQAQRELEEFRNSR